MLIIEVNGRLIICVFIVVCGVSFYCKMKKIWFIIKVSNEGVFIFYFFLVKFIIWVNILVFKGNFILFNIDKFVFMVVGGFGIMLFIVMFEDVIENK